MKAVSRRAYKKFFNKSANRRKVINSVKVKRGGIKL